MTIFSASIFIYFNMYENNNLFLSNLKNLRNFIRT